MKSKQTEPKTNLDSEKTESDHSDLDENEFSEEELEKDDILRLSKFFDQEPEALDNIQQIFEQYLSWEEFDPNNAQLLSDSLSIYLGEDNAELLFAG